MLITDRHIQYLELVEQGAVVLRDSQYTKAEWHDEHIEVDHIVAIHSELMGLTRITAKNETTVVALTSRGFAILNDEREAWG